MSSPPNPPTHPAGGQGSASPAAGLRKHEERALRAARRRSALDAVLASPDYLTAVGDLYRKFLDRVSEFRGHLSEAHRAAASERGDAREDLESLINLGQRLDFNGFFPEPTPRSAGLPCLSVLCPGGKGGGGRRGRGGEMTGTWGDGREGRLDG